MKNAQEMQEYIEKHLSDKPSVELPFAVGEEVLVINSYGLVWQGFKVIGFSDDPKRPDCHIHLNWDSYWFAPDDHRVLKKDDIEQLFRIYSPSNGYVALNKHDYVWSVDPANAELFTADTCEKYQAQGFINNIDKTVEDGVYLPALECKPHKTARASRVLQLLDSDEDAHDEYQTFVKLVAEEEGISIEQLETELEPFI
ncbi:hypothetical protein [Vibrio sp. Hal054]|uniref:hypothetical protein n=1 Tax=Vibrio sp. Hal054 TaxID=3035158 RepID=UPI00301B747A